MRIVIPDDYHDAVRGLSCFTKLAGHEVRIFNDNVKEIDALAERFRDADALVLIRERTSITDELLERLPRLRLISQTGKGTAHIDMDACARRGVQVAVGTGSPYAPAELTWALVLAARRLSSTPTPGVTVRGRTLGVFGYGKIGSLVAGFGRAFGMHVLAFGRAGSKTRADADGVPFAESKEALFETADVLSLHLRLTNETRGIITAADLARMKPDALLVNTARAELIESGALVSALRAKRPGFAAVDVYEEEPVTDDPLLSLPNVLCTPHLGYVERDSYELYFGQAFDAVVAFASREA